MKFSNSLILDIIIISSILIFSLWGMKRGFIASLFGIIKSILSIVIITFLTPYVKGILMENISFFKNFQSKSSFNTFLPKNIENTFLSPISDFVLSAVTFVFLYILVMFLLDIFNKLLSSRNKKNFIGFFDSLLGLIFGLIKGLLIVSLIIIVILPLLDAFGFSETLNFQDVIDKSFLGNYFYNENPLWKLFLLFSSK